MLPRILGRKTEFTSPWVEVEALEAELKPPRGLETFYTVKTHPYVVVAALTQDNQIPLVRQYRPAVDEWVLELPSGHVNEGESAEDAARRELREETGCDARELVPLGEFYVDPGRVQTKHRAFFAPGARVVAQAPSGEEQLEILFVTPGELRELVGKGQFRMVGHLGVLAAASFSGLLRL